MNGKTADTDRGATPARVLVIEPQKRLFPGIMRYLRSRGLHCHWASARRDGAACLRRHRPDIVLVDLDWPVGKGYKLVERIASAGFAGSLVALISPGKGRESLMGLASGADAIMEKPVPMPLLYARVLNLYTASKARGNEDVVFGDLLFQPSQHKVFAGGAALALTPLEYDILLYLARHARQVVSRESIGRFLQARPAAFVYSHIKNIRKKLAHANQANLLQTDYGKGYRLCAG